MSLGGEDEEDEELKEAETQGRNVGLLVRECAWETELRQLQALIEAVDIVQGTLALSGFILILIPTKHQIMKAKAQ